MIKEISNHRSIRNFTDKPIPDQIMQQALLAATRASTIGTMQLYSMIVTTDKSLLAELSALHMNQPASKAPALVTFCVDVVRFEKWCNLREADPDYKSFLWFVNGSIDALLASQNFCLEAQANGLGICYLGTTVYDTQKLIDLLNIPQGVIPITTVAVGYPANEVGLTHRLPLEAVVHYDKYQEPSNEQVEQFYSELESSDLTQKLIKENDLQNLAQIFTQRRYKKEDSAKLSELYISALKKQGFIK